MAFVCLGPTVHLWFILGAWHKVMERFTGAHYPVMSATVGSCVLVYVL